MHARLKLAKLAKKLETPIWPLTPVRGSVYVYSCMHSSPCTVIAFSQNLRSFFIFIHLWWTLR